MNPIEETGDALTRDMNCSDGWQVTGYYTPGESEFHGSPEEIEIHGYGRDQFPADFLRRVKIEGWGLTRHGWYLGWEHRWLKNDAALNARGQALHIGSLAVDPAIIPLGKQVRIPTLVAPWNTQLFVADDTGGAIRGKHVDVYCGAGPAAHAETLRITANHQRVCVG
ncbi:MAG TPA: 3D domain-containing protein [Blastocatellia bacterium]|nr:3D domain-containing protein [Blastocatellia bacterium]